MKAELGTKDGQPLLTVYYEGDAFRAAIDNGLKSYGLKENDCFIIAIPKNLREFCSRKRRKMRTKNPDKYLFYFL